MEILGHVKIWRLQRSNSFLTDVMSISSPKCVCLSLCSASPLPANFHDDHLLRTSATSPAQVPQPLCGRGVGTDFLKVGLLLRRTPLGGSRADCTPTIAAQRNLMEPRRGPIFLSVTRWPLEHLFSLIPRHVWDERIRPPGEPAPFVCWYFSSLRSLLLFRSPPLDPLFASPYPIDLPHCLFQSLFDFFTSR